MFALVDCNNFFVSCERVFNPALWNKPVIVLSNNDGCAIARSSEVKKLGIGMGQPIFQIKDLVQKHNIQVYSANFTLYADLSHRVMETLRQFSPNIEVYSIDEAFLALSGISDLEEYGKRIRNTIWQWVGIPVSVGIAQTKTLAKAANEVAKKHPQYQGSLVIDANNRQQILSKIDVGDVWGVGRQYTKFLNRQGIYTAFDLANCDLAWARKNLSVSGERMVRELNGQSCISLNEIFLPQKEIACTRSFGHLMTDLSALKQAVATFTHRAAEKLRQQESVAWQVAVFIHTNRHRQQDWQYANYGISVLPIPSSYTPLLIKHAHAVLQRIYKSGYWYKKAGVILRGINSNQTVQLNLLTKPETYQDHKQIMPTMDGVNQKLGQDTLWLASMGVGERNWKMRQNHRSNNFTSKWEELVVVK